MLLCPVEDLGFPRRQRDANLGEGETNLLFGKLYAKNCIKKKDEGDVQGQHPIGFTKGVHYSILTVV